MGKRPLSTESWHSDTTYHSLNGKIDDENPFVKVTITEKPNNTHEEPKIALRTQFRFISWLHPLVHLLPVAVTLAILQLSFRDVYWADEHDFDAGWWQAILQFPAKIHELLITGSLSAIVLHIFRRMVVGPHGIPLGLMVGAYQMGSAEYLFSKSFAQPLRFSLMRGHRKTFLVALALGMAILYTFFIGPASAGALLPNLGWWHIRHPYAEGISGKCYISRDSSTLYPIELKKADIDEECLGINSRHSTCPNQGDSLLYEWAWLRSESETRYNVTKGNLIYPTMTSTFSATTSRDIVTNLAFNTSTAAAITASLHSSVLTVMDAFWHFVSDGDFGRVKKAARPKIVISKNTKVQVPLVQVQCASVDYSSSRFGPPLTFNTDAMNTFYMPESDQYLTNTWMVPSDAWNNSWPSLNATVKWLNTSEVKSDDGKPLVSSLAAVILTPRWWYATMTDGSKQEVRGMAVSSCTIDARWATVPGVIFDARVDTIARDTITEWLRNTNINKTSKAALPSWQVTAPIHIGLDWIEEVNTLAYEDEDETINVIENTLQQAISHHISENGTVFGEFIPSNGRIEYNGVAEDIAVILSVRITDWLSRSTTSGTNFTALSISQDSGVSTMDLISQRRPEPVIINSTESFSKDQTEIIFEIQRYGWGYGLNSSTIWFSVIILLLHTVLVVIYFGYSFKFWYLRGGWTSGAWGGIGELVALAMSSPPADELHNSGAGIERSGTWMTKLRIRETDIDSDRIELVVGNRGGQLVKSDHLLRPDKKYA
ncbi:hypothetical protein F5Y18DRAFT_372982 [Xylariaceae sp. FL1019]|nr:hypothetical protein F5Y18DRAFT_372982 [Xylariaceae sp. FL1019]